MGIEGPARVMLVEDDQGIGKLLQQSLSAQYDADVTICGSLLEAQSAVATIEPELILLDLGLPDGDGLTFCRDLRLWSNVPVIVISAEGDDGRKVQALDSGADDFLVKPFSVSELMARVRSLWRRVYAQIPEGDERIVVGRLTVDSARYEATVDEAAVELTPKEFALLAVLARRRDKVASHRELLREVWGEGYVDEVHYVRNVVKSLRAKLDAADAGAEIVNTRSVGYRLERSE
jgi:two-component system KDP operon response regulator KdpE